MSISKNQILLGLLRISMGWIFLWSFLDKTFGLGFSTTADKSWLAGASPTTGFLQGGTKGPFVEIFHSLAGSPVVDWLYMLGMLLIGLALILGMGVKIAGYSGSLLMFFIWTALLLPKTNPFMDQHIIYILILIGFTLENTGHWLGFGKWWSQTALVKKFPFLE